MRKLTDRDISDIAGTILKGYKVIGVRIKRGLFTDSDHYGIILGQNNMNCYVTWQFHLDEDNQPSVYWGHYFMENREAALRDFDVRDMIDSTEDAQKRPVPRLFNVRITETLQKLVTIEADTLEHAEQVVSDNWKNSQYILGADDFIGVDFTACENNKDHFNGKE